MKFLIISHVIHTKQDGKYYGYGPYVKEMNLWLKYVDSVEIVAPLQDGTPDKIDLPYIHNNITFTDVPAFNFIGMKNKINSFLVLPMIFYKIIKAMKKADHIHLRCPGNMGLLGSVAQILFPNKIKTAKYAGNWDPNSPQPWSYRLQKKILSNTFLTHNMKVLVYGEWSNQSKNIVPFFTASYPENEITDFTKPSFKIQNSKFKINLIYVGALSPGKQPLLSIQTAERMHKEGYEVHLDLFGEGVERPKIESYIREKGLKDFVVLHGNQDADTVKHYYQNAHFLIFISKSEGWPKVVAEAMFWGCLPITSDVSCVNYMIGEGSRGSIAKPNVDDIVNKIKYYLEDPETMKTQSQNAMRWSRQFTLEKFEKAVGDLLRE